MTRNRDPQYKRGSIMNRKVSIDVAKGLLILLVVMAHYRDDVVHNVIFLFHMPLFIILSGMMLSKTKLVDIYYLKHRATSLLFPYFSYIIIDAILLSRDAKNENSVSH